MRLIDADALKKSVGDWWWPEVDSAPTVGGWISVQDRLPELGELVLVAIYGTDLIKPMDGETIADAVQRLLKSPGRVDVGFRDRDGWNDFCGPMIVTPTYWMPLPEPPEPQAQEPEKPVTISATDWEGVNCE